ncbi:MAG TPA: histidine phosphatase family protein [Ottowia sp.]|jgi:broad specificity phosphatase PhoE|nr:MAG: histidine phosphatase family protein [Burkholderiales bacterium 68-10]HOK11486.1 histidine phosphatase family protein [Ottowia sp.]HOM20454.1 histidine phosphatase family protein [Ottowia sp.]HRB09240.1 histidine phosphatase family protein [Ottowia sp.]
MGTLYLVRHGQASFGTDHYDQLSELGRRQSLRLGQYWRERSGAELAFDAVLTGTLARQVQTWQGIAEGAQLTGVPCVEWPGLNEYDSHAVISAIHPDPLPRPDTPERYRLHFRLLRAGLAAWMRGQVQPAGMPSYADFVHGVTSALDHVRLNYDGNVLLVSSGGPITTAIGQLLSAPAETTIELNMRYRNSAVTELAFTPRRHALVSYNGLPHLDDARYRDWITYA